MAQALAESIFDALYLTFAIVIGIYLIVNGGKGTLVQKFGIMALVLGAGLVYPPAGVIVGGIEALVAAYVIQYWEARR